MKCAICESTETKVTDVRVVNGKLRRRRQCLDCGEKFTTFEIQEYHIGEILEELPDEQTRIAAMQVFEKIYPPIKRWEQVRSEKGWKGKWV